MRHQRGQDAPVGTQGTHGDNEVLRGTVRHLGGQQAPPGDHEAPEGTTNTHGDNEALEGTAEGRQPEGTRGQQAGTAGDTNGAAVPPGVTLSPLGGLTARQWGQLGTRGHNRLGWRLGTWGQLGTPGQRMGTLGDTQTGRGWGHLGTARQSVGASGDTQVGDRDTRGQSGHGGTWGHPDQNGDTWGHTDCTWGHLRTPRQGVGSPGDTQTGDGDTWGQPD